MLRWVIGKALNRFERRTGVPGSLEYVRQVLGTSKRAFFRFARVIPFAEYRRRLPAGPRHVARLVAAQDEDCGTCVQMVVEEAKRDGVAPATIRSVLEKRPDDLEPDLADAYRFARAVVDATYDEEPLRERIRALHGEEGLVLRDRRGADLPRRQAGSGARGVLLQGRSPRLARS